MINNLSNFKYVVNKNTTSQKKSFYNLVVKSKITEKTPFILIYKKRNLKLKKLLGKGQEALVFDFEEKNKTNNLVIKIYKNHVSSAKSLLEFSHENLEKHFDFFTLNNKICISICEKLDTDLNNFFSKNEFTFWRIFNDIFNALKYLHGRKFLHIDLQENNVMFDQKFKKYKLIDLAFMEEEKNFSKKEICFNFLITPSLCFKTKMKWSYEVDYHQLILMLYYIWNSVDLWSTLKQDDTNNYEKSLEIINSINESDNQNVFIKHVLQYCSKNYIYSLDDLNNFYDFINSIKINV